MMNPLFRQIICSILTVTFALTAVPPLRAQEIYLPQPGVRVGLSPQFNPPILKGLKVHSDNPFRFDFILDKGDGLSSPNASVGDPELKAEANKLIKYFLASLTVPEKDLWVNLSPYEKDRIVPTSFGMTEMGRDLLAQDYLLKQITASLIYPEDEFGRKFWNRIYQEASKKYGTTNIPVNTFNKVWIVPEKAIVYENSKAGTAYVVESRLKVMLEQDYLALANNQTPTRGHVPQNVSPSTLPSDPGLNTKAPQVNPVPPHPTLTPLGSQIVREIVIPQLTKEVNENKNFAQLRQVYNSLILATWYKKKIKDSILSQVYADKNKINGLSPPKSFIGGPEHKAPSTGFPIEAFGNDTEFIYQQYLQAFKKGVYNYIKEEQDPITQQMIPRKYFSGGFGFAGHMDSAMVIRSDASTLSKLTNSLTNLGAVLVLTASIVQVGDVPSRSFIRPSVIATNVQQMSDKDLWESEERVLSQIEIIEPSKEIKGQLEEEYEKAYSLVTSFLEKTIKAPQKPRLIFAKSLDFKGIEGTFGMYFRGHRIVLIDVSKYELEQTARDKGYHFTFGILVHEALHSYSFDPHLLPSFLNEGITDFFAKQIVTNRKDLPLFFHKDNYKIMSRLIWWDNKPGEMQRALEAIYFNGDESKVLALMGKDNWQEFLNLTGAIKNTMLVASDEYQDKIRMINIFFDDRENKLKLNDAPLEFFSEGLMKVRVGVQKGKPYSIIAILGIYGEKHNLPYPEDVLEVFDLIEKENPGVDIGRLHPGEVIDLTGVSDLIMHQSEVKKTKKEKPDAAMAGNNAPAIGVDYLKITKWLEGVPKSEESDGHINGIDSLDYGEQGISGDFAMSVDAKSTFVIQNSPDFKERYLSARDNQERIRLLKEEYGLVDVDVEVSSIRSWFFVPRGTGKIERTGDHSYKLTLYGVDGEYETYLLFHEFMHIVLEEKGFRFTWDPGSENRDHFLFQMRNMMLDYIIERENKHRFGDDFQYITQDLRDRNLMGNLQTGQAPPVVFLILALTCKATTTFYPALSSSVSQTLIGQGIQVSYYDQLMEELRGLSVAVSVSDWQKGVLAVYRIMVGSDAKIEDGKMVVETGDLDQKIRYINEQISAIFDSLRMALSGQRSITEDGSDSAMLNEAKKAGPDAAMMGEQKTQRMLVPTLVSDEMEGQSYPELKSHQPEIRKLLAQLQDILGPHVNTRDEVLQALFGQGNEGTAQKFIEVASLLRTNFFYKENGYNHRPPLQYGIESNRFFRIGDHLYISPATESFKRHFIFKTDERGRVVFAFEVMIPGDRRQSFDAKGRKTVADDMNARFGDDYSVRVLLARTVPYQGLSLYGKPWARPQEAEILVYDYPIDGKRLANMNETIKEEWAKEMGIDVSELDRRINEQAIACFLAIKRAGYSGFAEFHIENFRVGRIYNQQGRLVDIKVQSVGDFGAVYRIGIKKEFMLAVVSGLLAYGSYIHPGAIRAVGLVGQANILALYFYDHLEFLFSPSFGGIPGLAWTSKTGWRDFMRSYFEARRTIKAAVQQAGPDAAMASIENKVVDANEMYLRSSVEEQQRIRERLAELLELLAYHGRVDPDKVSIGGDDRTKSIFVIDSQGQILGLARSLLLRSTGGALLEDLAVDERFQGRGLGVLLLKYMLAELYKKGVRYVSWVAGGESLGFYEKVLKPYRDRYPNPKDDAFFRNIDISELYRLQPDFNPANWDQAAIANTGGIDLNAVEKNLQLQNSDGEIKFNLDPAVMERLQNAPGFVPVIINIQPMTDLRLFLGVQETSGNSMGAV